MQSPPRQLPRFGRFELRQLLSRSLAATTWRAFDPRLEQEVLLCIPRAQPKDRAQLNVWNLDVLTGGRLKHPGLPEVLEVNIQDGWPYVSYPRLDQITLLERLSTDPKPSVSEIVVWMADVLESLAYAHDAGVLHRDIGLHTVLIDEAGQAQLAGLGVGLMAPSPGAAAAPAGGAQQKREAAENDVLMVGLLMHRLLAGQPALDDPDLCSAAKRVGFEIVRLPWSAEQPIPDTLRAIVNRATDRQHRHRYLNARTFLAAIQGWIKANENESGGPLGLLMDRLSSVGSLPSRPHTHKAFAQSLSKDHLRVDDIVDVVTKDPGLVWELLCHVNKARLTNDLGDEPITTITRAIVLLGQQGLRSVGTTMRPWPGAGTSVKGAQEALEDELRRACMAGHVARLLAPFSISDEEAFVAAMSHHLGNLLVRYHFPEEMAQIDRLIAPGPPPDKSSPPTPGMSLESAAGAVLGIDLGELSIAVMRHWGLSDRLQRAARPLHKTKPVRRPDDAEEITRAVASLANELTATVGQGAARQHAMLQHCFTRYSRALGLSYNECQKALETATRLVDAIPFGMPFSS